MPRAVSNVPRLKRKKQIMKAARGAFGARSKLWRPAKETVERGWKYAYRDRKNKKRDFRRLWITRINAGGAPERHELQHVHERPQAGRHRSEPKDPRRPRRARSRRVYRARRQGALRVERSVRLSLRQSTAAARPRRTAAVVALSVTSRPRRPVHRRHEHPSPDVTSTNTSPKPTRRARRSSPRLIRRPPTPTRSRRRASRSSATATGSVKALQEALARDLQGRQAGRRQALQRGAHAARVAARRAQDRARSRARAARGRDDLTLPARRRGAAPSIPVTLVIEEIEAIFRELGFTIASGPEAETRVVQLRRAQLSAEPSGARRARHALPRGRRRCCARTRRRCRCARCRRTRRRFACSFPGNVYRRDFFDASHAPAFAQIEGLCVDEGISFVDLKATLNRFAERFFGAAKHALPSDRSSRSPSRRPRWTCSAASAAAAGCAGVQGHRLDRDPRLGHGASRTCSRRRASTASGTPAGRSAWGRRASRISRYGIPDIRILYDSDVRFLEQIAE